MQTDIDHHDTGKGQLIHNNQVLTQQLKEANEIIDAIREGNIDAVFIPGEESSNILVSGIADQTYRRFIENMTEGVVALHPDGTIIYSNTSFAAMVHSPLEKVIGTKLLPFIPVEYIEHFESAMNQHPLENSKLELSITTSQAKRQYFVVSFNTLQLQDFKALNLVWTDVTEQKEAKHEVANLNNKLKENIRILNEANIELSAFAHIASHDLQEPLRKIITYSDLMQRDYSSTIGSRGQGYLDKIQHSSLRMRQLITDILEYSQVSQTQVLLLPVNLQTVIDEIFSDLEIVVKEIKAIIIMQKDLPVIEANYSQMLQLFQNLISNSLKFIKPGVVPEISITYDIITGHEVKLTHPVESKMLNEKFAVFYIKDNGIGFSPEYAGKIFTIFQRLNNNTAYKGTGIGLAICKKITEKHHGFIEATGAPGKGALFTITLPFSQGKSFLQNDLSR